LYQRKKEAILFPSLNNQNIKIMTTLVKTLKISYTNKKMQNLAKQNGFAFEWNTKNWTSQKGVEMSEGHPLFKFNDVITVKAVISTPQKMSYHDAYEAKGFDFAEEGNY
jgi:hypothetical protein